MTNNKKRVNTKNGSQRGNQHNDGLTSDNILSKEELEKAIYPTGTKNHNKR